VEGRAKFIQTVVDPMFWIRKVHLLI
jgi:hypothetical protein